MKTMKPLHLIARYLAIGVLALACAQGAANDIMISQRSPQDKSWVDRIFAPVTETPVTTAAGFLTAIGGTSNVTVNGYFADPSTNPSFSAPTWRSDLNAAQAGANADISSTSLLSSITRASGNITITPGSANTDRVAIGGLAYFGKRYSGDPFTPSMPVSGTSGLVGVLNDTTGAVAALSEYQFGHGVFFNNPSTTLEFFGYNGSFWNPVITLISSTSGTFLQLRNLGDTNSLVFRYGLGENPSITTEGADTDIEIEPTGNILFAPTGSSKYVRSQVDINRVSESGVSRGFYLQTSPDIVTPGSDRWGLTASAEAESGANAGSNFSLIRYADDGSFLESAFTINRASGNATVAQRLTANSLVAPTVTTPTINTSSGDLTVSPVGALNISTGSGFTTSTDLSRQGSAGTVRAFNYRTGTSQRFASYIDSSSESGANAGSNFVLARYDDSGNFLESAFSISRATGNVTIPQRATVNSLAVGNGGFTSTGIGTISIGSSGATASSAANVLTIEGSSQTGPSILAPNNQYTNIFFGGPADNSGGRIYYGGTTVATTADRSNMIFFAGGGERLRINSLTTAITGNATVSGNMTVQAGSSVTTGAAGAFAFDTDAWAASRGAMQVYDGTANTYVVAALASDTPTNGQTPVWNTGGTVTWETRNASTVTGYRTGTATLVAGTVTVSDASTAAGTRIRLSMVTPGGTVGAPFISAKVNSTSFTITSTSALDTSTIYYEAFEP